MSVSVSVSGVSLSLYPSFPLHVRLSSLTSCLSFSSLYLWSPVRQIRCSRWGRGGVEEQLSRCVSQCMGAKAGRRGSLPLPLRLLGGGPRECMGPGRGPAQPLTPAFLLQMDPRTHLAGLDCGVQLRPPSSGPPGCLPVRPYPPLDKWLCLIALCVYLGEGQYWGQATPAEGPPTPLGTLEPSFTLALMEGHGRVVPGS